MNPNVLRRFVVYMGVTLLVAMTAWALVPEFFARAPGDYETRTGDLRLKDKEYGKALAAFDAALKKAPNHRGAMMGRALVFIQTKKYEAARAELTALITFLGRTLEKDDMTGRGALAAAYANRGIVNDRQGRYREALRDYLLALRTDEETVEGPDLVHRILYGNTRPSTVRKRAKYLFEQLKLPPEKRILRIPELDAKQRMYKP